MLVETLGRRLGKTEDRTEEILGLKADLGRAAAPASADL